MTHEPLLDEIRRVRHEISAELGHDPRKIAAYYTDLQRLHRSRMVDLSGEVASTELETVPSKSVDNDKVVTTPNC